MEFMRATRACLLLALAVPRLLAQGASARLLLGGGTATDLRGVRSGAWSVAPSLNLQPSAAFALGFGGRGTRFSDGEWSLGGSASAAFRLPLPSGFGLQLGGGGEAIRTSYHASYLWAEGDPALAWRHGPLTLWGGAHGATARTTLAASGLPLAANTLTRSQLGPVFGVGLHFVDPERRSTVELTYREEHGRPGGISLADRSGSVALAEGTVALSGTLGYRDGPDEQRLFGGARVAVTLVPGVTVIGAAESYPANRLLGTVGGRSFTAGLSLGIGGPRRVTSLPVARGVPAVTPGFTRLSFRAKEAERVEVAGDWNGWHLLPLTRAANGVWYADLAIPRGLYRYAFRVNGTHWEVPKGIAAVDDGFGGKSAWLSVTGPPQAAAQSANRKEAP